MNAPLPRPDGAGRFLRPGDRIAIIVNPAAWRTQDAAWREEAQATLGATLDVEWVSPPAAEAVGEIVTRARDAGARAVIVAGGDGTVSRAIEALAGTDTPLGLLPLGTGNDLARELGLPIDVRSAIPRLLEGRPRVLDLVEVNGRPYATVGLLGLTAESAVRVGTWQVAGGWRRIVSRALGRQAYRVSGTLSLVHPRRAWQTCSIHIDAPEERRLSRQEVFGLFVTNGSRCGSGLVLPVRADPADGRFEVCLVRRVPRVELIYAFLCLMRQKPLPPGILEPLSATSAVVEWPEPAIFSADGESLVTDRRFELRIRPAALRVIA